MKKSKMLLALLVLSAAGALASCVNTSTSSSAPAPSTSSAPAPSTSSSAPAPSTSSSAPAPSTSTSSSASIPNEITTVMSVAEAIAHMQGTNWKEGQIIHVTGVVTEVKYQEQYGSYNIVLEGGFEIYSGKLAADVEVPVVGATITASGMSKIYNTTYEIAYNNTDKVSPNIYKVENPEPQVPTFEVPTYLENENVSDWEVGEISANKALSGEYMVIVPRTDKAWTVENKPKTAEDGTEFTNRLKPNGKTTAKGGYIQIETAGATTLEFYAISGSSDTRTLTVVKDWASVVEALPEDGIVASISIPGDKLVKYTVELADAATYVLHLNNAINFYSFELIDKAAGNQEVEIATLRVEGPEELKVGETFDPSKYTVYGVSEDGKYEHLLETSEYKLGTVDTTTEKTGENALELTASYVGFDAIKGACDIEVWNWYDVTFDASLENLLATEGGKTEFKNGTVVEFVATPAEGYDLKSVVVEVNGVALETQPVVEDNRFTVEAKGDINVKSAEFELYATSSVTIGTLEHGAIVASANEVKQGTEVTFTVTPDADYVLDTLVVTVDGVAIDAPQVIGGKFTVDATGDVVVNATFKSLSGVTLTDFEFDFRTALTSDSGNIKNDSTNFKTDETFGNGRFSYAAAGSDTKLVENQGLRLKSAGQVLTFVVEDDARLVIIMRSGNDSRSITIESTAENWVKDEVFRKDAEISNNGTISYASNFATLTYESVPAGTYSIYTTTAKDIHIAYISVDYPNN